MVMYSNVPQETEVSCRDCLTHCHPPYDGSGTYMEYLDYRRTARIAHLRRHIATYQRLRIDPRGTTDYMEQIRNLCFLLRFYEAGGGLTPPGTTRWVYDGRFIETSELISSPSSIFYYTPDSVSVFFFALSLLACPHI